MLKPQEFAGRAFSLDHQCKSLMGPNASSCPYSSVKKDNYLLKAGRVLKIKIAAFPSKEDICKKLWCFDPSLGHRRCLNYQIPPALGTSCGHNKICNMGECVNDTPLPTEPWGIWTAFGCSRTCGGGVRYYMRRCLEPGYCKGSYIKYELCNTQPCGDVNYLKSACLQRASKLGYSNNSLVWFPGYRQATSCRLYCKSTTGKTINYPMGDGGPCSFDNTNNRCIRRICRPAGCDNKLGSSAVLDKCGVCNGDDSTCTREAGVVNVPPSLPLNMTLFLLPKGARSIVIEFENLPPSSFLSIETLAGISIMNNFKQEGSLDKSVYEAGTIFTSRQSPGTPENLITTAAPLMEDLLVKIVREENLTTQVNWTYYRHPNDSTNRFFWTYSIAQCSVTCGNGTQKRHPICMDYQIRRTVADVYCIPSRRLKVKVEPCSRLACPNDDEPPKCVDHKVAEKLCRLFVPKLCTIPAFREACCKSCQQSERTTRPMLPQTTLVDE